MVELAPIAVFTGMNQINPNHHFVESKVIAWECGNRLPLSFDVTCHVVPKRGRVRALQIPLPLPSTFRFCSSWAKPTLLP
jgi:hypothetical protein